MNSKNITNAPPLVFVAVLASNSLKEKILQHLVPDLLQTMDGKIVGDDKARFNIVLPVQKTDKRPMGKKTVYSVGFCENTPPIEPDRPDSVSLLAFVIINDGMVPNLLDWYEFFKRSQIENPLFGIPPLLCYNIGSQSTVMPSHKCRQLKKFDREELVSMIHDLHSEVHHL